MAEPLLSSQASEPEPTVDEYARQNGLSLDSKLDALSYLSSIPLLDNHNGPDTETELLKATGVLPSLHIPPGISPDERPNISKASVKLLNAAIRREDNQKHIPCLTLLASISSRRRCLKLELPVLRSDQESDFRELERTIKAQKHALVQKDFLPSEPLVVSQDEAIEFPNGAYSYRDELRATTNESRLTVPRGVLQYLGTILKCSWSTADTTTLLMNEITSRKTAKAALLTPPLSPLKMTQNSFIPDPDVCLVPIPSDPSTLFEQDLDAAHVALVQGESPSPRLQTIDLSPIGDTPRISATVPRFSSLKLEGPLTPMDLSQPIPNQPDLMADMGQAAACLELRQDSNDMNLDFRDESKVDFSDDLTQELREAAVHCSRRIEQERLLAMDAVARVPVPVMDFSIPELTWNRYDWSSRRHFKLIMANIEAQKGLNWPKDSGADSKLRWNPFPSRLGQVSLRESIEEDVDLHSLLNFVCEKEVSSSSAYVWKQPGLSILRDLEDEEELETLQVQLSEDADLDSIVRKRKLEAEDNDQKLIAGPSSDWNELTPDNHVPPLLCAINDPSATTALLANYVDFQTFKRRKGSKSLFFTSSKSAKPISNANTTAIVKPTKPQLVHNCSDLEKTIRPAPCPNLKALEDPVDIIVAITLGRGIVSAVEKLLPMVNMIERDFNRYNVITWNRNSVSRSPITSTLSAEADIVISPTTGIVLTTVIKAIQKPLPGHKGKATIRERFEKIGVRYERLIVLVSAANRFDECVGDITASECTALSDFIGFVAGLDTNGQVYFVGGGDETLSKWVAFFITRYYAEAASVRGILIAEETTWEMVLRRAGLNAFAAQAILAALKPPEGTPKEAMKHYGLSGFIKMSATERLQEFGQLMGGGKVLQKVGAVLDSQWA